MTVSAHSLLMM